MKAALAIRISVSLISVSALADDSQPYIDRIRQQWADEHKEAPTTDEGYTEKLQSKLKAEEAAKHPDHAESYIDRLKRQDPERYTDTGSGVDTPFIDRRRSQLEPKAEGGAIQAVNEGRSDLKMKRPGDIHHAFGLRYGLSLAREISGDTANQLAPFSSVYATNYAPDLALFYEYQPFHSEWFGNIGIEGQAGVAYYHGNGNFPFQLPIAGGGGAKFPLQSQTQFRFFDVPLTLGINYRFNLFRIVRPFVFAGGTFVLYQEQRGDLIPGHQGYSTSFTGIGGVNILLDGLSKAATWDLYNEFGIKHLYLTIEYQRLIPLETDVSFAISGVFTGFTFEL